MVQVPPGADPAEKRVSWIELFFDLAFVAAIAQVSSALSSDYSAAQFARYALMFILIWSAWAGQTWYCSRFEATRLSHKLATVVQCFIAAVMAANAKDALDSRASAGFGAAYAGLRLILALEYLHARSFPATRTLATRYAAGYGTAALIWVSSALTPAPLRFWLWGIGFVVDFATPFLAGRHAMRVPPHHEHVPERFSLFFLIVTGEFVACVMRGIEAQEYWSATAASTAIGGIVYAFVLAAWHFERARANSARHLRTRTDAARHLIWSYAHLPLCLAIVAAGVGVERAITFSTSQQWTRSDGAVLMASAVTTILMFIAIERSTAHASEGPARRRGLVTQGISILLAGAFAASRFDDNAAATVWAAIAISALCCVRRKAKHVHHKNRDFQSDSLNAPRSVAGQF